MADDTALQTCRDDAVVAARKAGATAAFIGAGCREGNRLMRHPAALLGLKTLWLAWWRYEAGRSPAGFSHAGDDRYAVAFYAAAAINVRAATNGCVLW